MGARPILGMDAGLLLATLFLALLEFPCALGVPETWSLPEIVTVANVGVFKPQGPEHRTQIVGLP